VEKILLKFGLGVNVNEKALEAARKSLEAERLGIDFVWVSDVPNGLYAPIVASAIAAKTKKIRIGLGLISPFLHTPAQIANCLQTLYEAYGERFELCIGPGDRSQLRRVGINLSQQIGITAHLLNAKKQIRKILRRNRVKVRIWLGAQGPKLLEASRLFNGVLLNLAHPKLIEWAINKVGPVKNDAFEFGVYAPSYVYRDFDPNIYKLLRASAAVVALGTHKTILERLNLTEEIAKANRRLDAGSSFSSVLAGIPRRTVELFSIFKSSSEIEQYLLEISKMKIKHMVFSYPQNHSEKTVKELATALKDHKRKHA